MLNLNPQIYPPLKIQAIIKLITTNFIFELTVLFLFLFFIRLKKFKKTYLIHLLIIAELFFLTTGNLFTIHKNLLDFNLPIDFKNSRYLSTADTVDYYGLHVYWNHLRVRQPFAPDLSDSELDNFDRLTKEINQLPGNLNIFTRDYNASGYSAVVLKNYAKFFNSSIINSVAIKDLNDPRLEQIGVNYIVTGYPDDQLRNNPGFTQINSSPAIYQTRSPSPRAYFQSKTGQVEMTRHQPGYVSLNTKNPQHDTLVLADSFYPGWTAAIDSQPTIISPYLDAFQSIQVPSGEHTITFSYRPRSVTIGFIITSLTLIISISLILWPNQKLDSLFSTGTVKKTL